MALSQIFARQRPGVGSTAAATATVTEIIHQLFAKHLKALVADVANQATDRLAAQIETGRREVASQSDAGKATASRLVNDAGAWSAEKLERFQADWNRCHAKIGGPNRSPGTIHEAPVA